MNTQAKNQIKEAILSESRYMEENRQRWICTKKLARRINESLLPENFRISVSPGSIYIYIPWGVDALKKTRQAIGEGWKHGSNYNSTDGSMTRNYHCYEMDNKGDERYISLCITLDAAQLNPGTCKKILVEKKEKVYVQEVYKVICEDGIETLETAEIPV